VAAVKPEADKDNPKEQHRHDDVISFSSQAVRPMPPRTTARSGVAQQIAANTAPIAPLVMRERSVMRDQLFSAEG
jgi:hypothetical protein